ncbi:MAG: glycogen-binding domain-containing protein [Endomicrobiales bacterium]|nr:glycogen-binding domain-containing protein [Endomicrobiales bacterium]
MNRKNLISLLILDAVVIVFAFGLILYRYDTLNNKPLSPTAKTRQEQTAETVKLPAANTANDTKASDQLVVTINKGADEKSSARNIKFTYRNSKVNKVQIIGDFTEWVPKAMKKGQNHKWEVTLNIAPGDYAYNYVVNGKPIRDPNNPKVCNVGRGFPNSFLSVKPLTDDNKTE